MHFCQCHPRPPPFLRKCASQIYAGVGEKVKIPGPSAEKPNIYEFGQKTYEQIEDELRDKDEALYLRNNLIQLMNRNKGIKECPQRFADVWPQTACDIVFSFEVLSLVTSWFRVDG